MQKNEVEDGLQGNHSLFGKPRSCQQSSASLSVGAQREAERGPLKLQTLNVHPQVQHLFLLSDLLLLKRHLVGFLLRPPFLFREVVLKLITSECRLFYHSKQDTEI